MSTSSNSEDDRPVKTRVVRRKRKRVAISDEESGDAKINLYSHSVLPKVQNVNKEVGTFVKQAEKSSAEDQADSGKPLRRAARDKKKKYDDDDYVEEVDSNNEESLDLPEPPKAEGELKENTRIRKKINKLKDTLDTLKQQDNVTNTNVAEAVTKSPKYEKTMFVKIRLRGDICKYPLKMSENFEMVLKNIGLRNNVSINRVLITKGDTRILPSHTPKSLNLNVVDILECVLLEKEPGIEPPKDTINIQMQCSFQRTKISYPIAPKDSIKGIMEKYANHVGYNMMKLIFQFDGDRIQPEETPESLDMTDGDCIDVIRKDK